ncbi:hypothetical protein INT44_001870 [Umbelopsis vinacea]|uniref:Wbp11/ELF5/Saf1 N-terminal domain-containing protein n=1 Tax=Umbelopsis vinacea TaxID=44442 RepID=A0A8H7UEJ7_9FUNG|nr:hypothetical protein INT44_001870 [Umbelopsis vinacea]
MAVVNRDTTKIEREIERMEDLASQRQLDKTGQAKLKSLKEELETIQKTKEAHGVTPQSAAKSAVEESRKLVFDPKKGAFVPISKKKLAKMEAKKAKAGQHQGSDDSSSDSDDDSDDSDSGNELLPELPVIKGEDILEEEEAQAAASKIEEEDDQEVDIEPAQEKEEEVEEEDIPLPNDEDEDSDIESIPMPKGPPPRKPFEQQLGRGNLTRPPPPPPRHYRPPPHRVAPPPPPRPPHMQHGHFYGHGPYHPQEVPAVVHASAVQPISHDVDNAPTEAVSAPVTISAAPQVRDLQKELVGFVPAAVRKKKLQAGKKGSIPKVARPAINAAPDMDDDEEETSPVIQLPAATPVKSNEPKAGDEYDRFMREMEGIL